MYHLYYINKAVTFTVAMASVFPSIQFVVHTREELKHVLII